jgi:hypothetical protein
MQQTLKVGQTWLVIINYNLNKKRCATWPGQKTWPTWKSISRSRTWTWTWTRPYAFIHLIPPTLFSLETRRRDQEWELGALTLLDLVWPGLFWPDLTWPDSTLTLVSILCSVHLFLCLPDGRFTKESGQKRFFLDLWLPWFCQASIPNPTNHCLRILVENNGFERGWEGYGYGYGYPPWSSPVTFYGYPGESLCL